MTTTSTNTASKEFNTNKIEYEKDLPSYFLLVMFFFCSYTYMTHQLINSISMEKGTTDIPGDARLNTLWSQAMYSFS